MKKKNISFILNVLIFVFMISGLILETFEYVLQGASLTFLFTRFKYFTELSNIFVGIICGIYAYYIFTSKKKTLEIPDSLKLLKVIATNGVVITFLTVIFYLIPVLGNEWYKLVIGFQFLFHIMIPILAFITYLFFEDNYVKTKYVFLNLIPIVTYGLFYLVAALTHMENGKVLEGYDWYLFLSHGLKFGLLTYVFFIVFNIGLVYILNKLNKRINSK